MKQAARQSSQSTTSLPAPWRYRLAVASIALAASGMSLPALAAPAASVSVKVGATSTSVSLVRSGSLWVPASSGLSFTSGGASIVIASIWLDPDPVLHADIQAQNLGDGDAHFEIRLETPFDGPQLVNQATSQLSWGSVVDGGAAGVVVSPSSASMLTSFGVKADDSSLALGVDLLNSPLTLSGGNSGRVDSAGQGFAGALPIVAFNTTLAFDLSGHDSVSVAATVTVVPEPALWQAWAGGLVSLAAFGRSRRARSPRDQRGER